MKRALLLTLVLVLAVTLAGCGSKGKELSGSEKDAVLAFSEAKTDTLLAGMNANDYAMFSTDFDQDMLNAMTEARFAAMKQERDASVGQYLSRRVLSVAQTGDFYAVTYDAKFEKKDSVGVRVVFRVADPHEVSGLWFAQ